MSAKIETDNGEVLKVQYPNGKPAGKAILAFLTALSLYCNHDDFKELQWFSKLEVEDKEPLCSLGSALIEAFSSGDYWSNFREDEYEFFRHRYPDISIPESEFISMIKGFAYKWVNLEILITSIEMLSQRLRELNPVPSAWYEPVDTLPDFQALEQTLQFFISRGTPKVRIIFD